MEKVTILALHLGFGGVEKSIASLSNILVDKYEVEIISVYHLYEKPAFYIDGRVEIKYLLPKELSPNKKEIKEAIKSKNPIQILKEGIKSIKILKLKKSTMIKAVKSIKSGIVISTRIDHNKILSDYGDKSLITIAQEHTYHDEDDKYIEDVVKSCENIDYFMPVSKFLTEFYSKYFKGTNTNCKFIPHSLDFIPDTASTLKEKNIVSIGRLSPEKGFLDLVEVFNIVCKEKDDWKLNIVGDGEEKELIEEKISLYNLEDKIILHGYRDKEYISDLFMDSSVYAMTSLEESFGLVLIEAQSFGIPCVAFDSAKGACEIIKNNYNGYLISDRSKIEMANKLINLIENTELRESMGIRSRENAYQYSKKEVANKWFDFLEKANKKV